MKGISRTTEHQRLLDLMRRIARLQELDSLAQLAAKYKITEETVYKWCRKERVPIRWARRFEEDTRGTITRAMVSPWAYH